MPVPQSLHKKLREGLVVPFVGAGVSMSVLDRLTGKPVFPSWRGLLFEAADRLERETKHAEAELVRSLLNVKPPDFLQAADRARKALGTLWYECLRDKLDIEFEKIDQASLQLARHVWRLGSKLVITTNYDAVLKWACPWPSDLQSWNIQAPAEQASLLQRTFRRPVVWHLHGRISNASDIILSPDGYRLLYPENNTEGNQVKYEAALQTLRHQIAAKSLLFVGFSLDDEYFGLQLREVHKIYKGAVGPHYAIVREEHAERVRDLNIEPVTVSDFRESLLGLMTELEGAVGSSSEVFSIRQDSIDRPTDIPDYGPHHPVFLFRSNKKAMRLLVSSTPLRMCISSLLRASRQRSVRRQPSVGLADSARRN